MPDKRIVVAVVSNWPAATSSGNRAKLIGVLAGMAEEAGTTAR